MNVKSDEKRQVKRNAWSIFLLMRTMQRGGEGRIATT
jgi:hypothetical protein